MRWQCPAGCRAALPRGWGPTLPVTVSVAAAGQDELPRCGACVRTVRQGLGTDHGQTDRRTEQQPQDSCAGHGGEQRQPSPQLPASEVSAAFCYFQPERQSFI